MKLLRWVAVLLMVPMVTVHAQSDRWVVVGTGADGGVFYVDTAHVVVEGTVRTAWGKTVYSTEQTSTYEKTHYFILLANSSYDCKHRSITTNAEYFEDQSENIIQSIPKLTTNWAPVLPETTGESKLDAICKLHP